MCSRIAAKNPINIDSLICILCPSNDSFSLFSSSHGRPEASSKRNHCACNIRTKRETISPGRLRGECIDAISNEPDIGNDISQMPVRIGKHECAVITVRIPIE